MADEVPTPTNSRPVSRAQSDVPFAIERPGSPTAPRSIAREVDHIKALIKRSQTGPRQSEGSITAQVFQRKSSSHEQATHARIFHELDLLKKRIRNELYQVRRPSEVDPGSESEADDVPDEREEELQSVIEKLNLVRQQREEWIEAAESRIDTLINEKEHLADALRNNSEELKRTRADKEAVEEALQVAVRDTEHLTAQLHNIRKTVDSIRAELEGVRLANNDAHSGLETARSANDDLNRELRKAHISLNDTRAQLEEAKAENEQRNIAVSDAQTRVNELQNLNEDAQAAVAESRKRVCALQEENSEAAKQLQRTIDEHALSDSAAKEKLQALQGQHEELTNAAAHSRERLQDLTRQLVQADTAASESQREHEARQRELADQLSEQIALLEKSTRHTNEHEREIRNLTDNHDRAKVTIEQLFTERDEYEARLRSLTIEKLELQRRVKQDSSEHDRRIQALEAQHEEERKSLRDEQEAEKQHFNDLLQSAHAANSKELDNLRSELDSRVHRLQSELDSKTLGAEEAETKSKNKLADLAGRLAKEAKESRSFREQLQKGEASHRERIKEMEIRSTELEEQLEASQKRFHEAVVKKNSQEAELGAEIIRKTNEFRELQNQMDQLNKDKHSEITELLGKDRELEKALENAQSDSDLHAKSYESSLQDLRSTHAKTLKDQHQAHTAEIEHLQYQASKAAVQAKQGHSDVVADLEKSHHAALEGASRDAQDRLRQLQESHAAEIERLRSEQSAAQEKTFEDKDSQHQIALRDLRAVCEDNVANHKAEVQRFQNQISHLQDDHRLALEKADKDHEDALGKLMAQHEWDKETARADAEKQLKEFQADHSTVVAALYDQQGAAKDQLVEKHKIAIAEMQDQHRLAIESVSEGENAAIADLAAKHKSILEAAEVAAENRFDELRSTHASEIANLTETHKDGERDLATAHQRALDEAEARYKSLQASHKSNFENVRKEHSRFLAQLQCKHDAEIAGWSSKANEAATSNQADMQRAAEDASRNAIKDFENQLAQRDTTAEARLAAVRESDASELAKAREAHSDELKAAHEAIETSKSELVAAKAHHEQKIARLQETLSNQLGDLKIKYNLESERVMSEHRMEVERWSDERQKILDMQEATSAEHQKVLTDLRSKHSDEKQSLRTSHEQALAALQSELEKQSASHLLTNNEEHRASLATALAEADSSAEEKLRAQNTSHSDELAQLHETLTTELTTLQAELEQASELRQGEMQQAQSDREKASLGLNENLKAAEQKASALISEQEAMAAELVALKARLDAELTAHAEAKRSLAELRKQKCQEDKRAADSKDALEAEVSDPENEKQNLEREHRRDIFSLQDAQNVIKSAGAETADSHSADDVTALKQQLAIAEQESRETQAFLQQKLDEKSELARQNEFLVKELEDIMSQLSSPRLGTGGRRNAQVQTEPLNLLARSDQPQDAPGEQLPVTIDELTRSRGTPQANGIRQEPRADTATLLLERGKRVPGSDDPARSRSRQVRDNRESRAWKTRSFEDYLHLAQAELSELGSVISANETLFAQKIQEHVGDLQRAKDQLAAEYKEKFDSLLAHKERMEKAATSRGAAAFAKERDELVAKYGIEGNERQTHNTLLSSLPVAEATALRTAEESLVSEYNRRIAKKKSQIAMQHAEDFQSLTHDYDRKVAELLSDRERLEGDLSVEPARFEQDLDELEVRSVQLEAEKAGSVQSSPHSNKANKDALEDGAVETAQVEGTATERPSTSRLRKRVLTSTPRTPTSIPKAVPYPGHKASVKATAQVQTPRTPSEERNTPGASHPPVPQRSLMRVRSPPDGPLLRRVVSTPRTSDKWASPSSVKGNAAQDLSLEPSVFEQHAGHQPKSRTPSDTENRPGIHKPSGRRSLRHSSGIIYRQAPKQQD